MAELEAVMTVELQIRGPYPIGEQRLAVNIESGSLLGFGAFEGKLSGSVIAPSGDVIVVQKTGTFERNVRLVASMEDGSHLLMEYGGQFQQKSFKERQTRRNLSKAQRSTSKFNQPLARNLRSMLG